MTLRIWYEKCKILETENLGQTDADLFFSLIMLEEKNYHYISDQERKELTNTIFNIVNLRCRNLNFDTSDSFKVFITEMSEGIPGVAVLYVSLAKIDSIVKNIENYKLADFRALFPTGLLSKKSEDELWKLQTSSEHMIDKWSFFNIKGIDKEFKSGNM